MLTVPQTYLPNIFSSLLCHLFLSSTWSHNTRMLIGLYLLQQHTEAATLLGYLFVITLANILNTGINGIVIEVTMRELHHSEAIKNYLTFVLEKSNLI